MCKKSSAIMAALLGILLSINSTMVFSSSDSDSGSDSDSDSDSRNNGVHSVPEPTTLALVLAGLVGVSVAAIRKKK